MYSTVMIVAFVCLLPFSAYAGLEQKPSGLVIYVTKDGDDYDCRVFYSNTKPCKTIDYVLKQLDDYKFGFEEVLIIVSNDQNLHATFPIHNSTIHVHKLTIVGKGDVVFRCTKDSFELFLQRPEQFVDVGVVHMKGLHFENCYGVKDAGINIGSNDIQDLVLEDCTFTNGGPVLISGQFNSVKVDNCTFEKLDGTLQPVLVYNGIFPTIVMNKTVVTNNFGSNSSSQGSGMMMIRVSAPYLLANYPAEFDITIKNCTFTNNTMEGEMLPIITLVPGHRPISSTKNITVTVTISYTNFTDNSSPPYILLDDILSAELDVTMINSVFQSSTSFGFPPEFGALHILQYTSFQTSNVVRTNVIYIDERN